MIELGGIRYAAGKPTSTVMWAATAFACTSNALLVGGMVIYAASWRRFDWMDTLTSATSLMMQLYLVGGVVVAQLLLVSDSQSVVRPVPTSRTKALWNSQASLFVRSSPVTRTLAIITTLVIGRDWIVPLHHRPLYALYLLVVAGLAVWQGAALCTISRYMRQEATTLVDGRLNKKRDWDWDRYNTTDDQAFRSRFGSWTPPKKIKHPAEAADYASQVRQRRFMWTGVSSVLIVILGVLATQPIAAQIHAIVHTMTHLAEAPESTSVFDQMKLPVLLLASLVPALIQYRIGEYGDLAKIYDDRAKELLAKKPQSRMVARRGLSSRRRHRHVVAGSAHRQLIRRPA